MHKQLYVKLRIKSPRTPSIVMVVPGSGLEISMQQNIPSVSSVMLVEFWFQWKRFIIRYHWLKVDHMIEAI